MVRRRLLAGGERQARQAARRVQPALAFEGLRPPPRHHLPLRQGQAKVKGQKDGGRAVVTKAVKAPKVAISTHDKIATRRDTSSQISVTRHLVKENCVLN